MAFSVVGNLREWKELCDRNSFFLKLERVTVMVVVLSMKES